MNELSSVGASKSTVLVRRFRLVLGLFISALVLSGITAFPLQRELDLLCSARGLDHLQVAAVDNSLDRWLLTIRDGLHDVYSQHPWMAYGTDWLAFAHIIIAIFFVGAWVHPVRNAWVLQAGLIACGLVVPLALICGALRQIPFGWRLIDCSFGIIGSAPLWYCLKIVKRLPKNPIAF